MGYVGLAYPAIAYEVATDPGRFAADASAETVVEDLGRVGCMVCLWATLFLGLRLAPAQLLPTWFAEQRRAPEGRFDTVHKPANMVVSLIHSIVAVTVGSTFLLPQLRELCAGEEEAWHQPMTAQTAWFIAMFQGYQLCDTGLGWAGQSPMHRLHHCAGLLAWGYPLFARSDATIVPVAYLLAEVANPFMHLRWCLKYWDKHATTLGQINEALCVVSWLVVRNIPELYVCWSHAWFEDALPLTWRLTVATGNCLTLIWSSQIFAMLARKFQGKDL